MIYTTKNFKSDFKAKKIEVERDVMIATEDGVVKTNEGNLNVKKGDYIIRGYYKDGFRVWINSKKDFESSYIRT